MITSWNRSLRSRLSGAPGGAEPRPEGAVLVEAQEHAVKDLELRIPAELSETDVEVLLVLQPVKAGEPELRKTGWPEGYFERTFGSLRDNPITYEPALQAGVGVPPGYSRTRS